MPLDCWVNGLMQSHYFLCCVTSDELTKDGVLMPDCWENGWAEKSREACCNTDAFEHMDVRAMSLTKGSTESPCANADNQTLKYLEDAGERLFLRPFEQVFSFMWTDRSQD